MDLTPLKLYRTLIPFKEKSDASVLFKRICNDLSNERINILKMHGLISFFGGESTIKKELEKKLVTPADVERENELNEIVNSVLNKFKNKFKAETHDFRQIIGYLVGKAFNKATFNSLEKALNSLPKTPKVYVSNKLQNEPCSLLTNEFETLISYRDVPELVDLVDNQLSSGSAFDAVNGKSSIKRTSFIDRFLVPKYHFLTKEQVDKVLDEAAQARLLKAKEIRNRSRRVGIFAFIGTSLLFFLGFFFLSLLATFWGYSQFGTKVSGVVSDSINYKSALFGMIFILPTFFMATYFGAYERRWALTWHEDSIVFQVAPRFIPSATLITHAVLLFNLSKHVQGDAANNIFYKVFYLGDKGYTLALIYIFLAVTTLIMDLFSIPKAEELKACNEEGIPPGRLWLTQNSCYYIIPFAFFLRLFMPAIPLSVMVALTILTFIFGFAAPVAVFVIHIMKNREEGNGPYCGLDPFVLRRGGLAAVIFAAVMTFTYLMMTHVHANPNWFHGEWWKFFTNLGWFFILLIIIAGCTIGLAQLAGIDLDADSDGYLDISPSFYFFILGFILLFFIIPKGTEASPNIYYQGLATGPVVTFIILLMIVSSIHDVCCLISADYDLELGFSATRVSNVGFILATITLYILGGAMQLFWIYVLAIIPPLAVGAYYLYMMSENANISMNFNR